MNKFKIKPKAPMLVYRAINPTIETKERAAILAIYSGHGTHEHFNLLQDVFNLLYIASTAAGREFLQPLIPKYSEALKSVQDRYVKFCKFGMDYKDNRVLTDMINTSADFWIRQPTEFYMLADAEVRKFYKSLNEGKENENNG